MSLGGSCSPMSKSADIPLLQRNPKTGKICLNPEKDSEKWFYLTALGPNNAFPTVLPANGSAVLSLIVPAEQNLRGDFEISNLFSTSTGRFSAQIYQASINRYFQNTPVPNNAIFGCVQLPGSIPETLYVQPTTTVQITVTDLSGQANTISIVARGRRFLDWGRERMGEARRQAFLAKRTHPYSLLNNTGTNFPLTALATANILLTVPSAADFECLQLMDDSDGDYTVQIFEGLSSRALMNQPISSRDFVAAPTVGVPGMPSGGLLRASGVPARVCSWTHNFKRSSTLVAAVTDTSGFTTNNIRLTFGGRLVYYAEPEGQQLTLPENIGQRVDAPVTHYAIPTGGNC